MNEHSLSSSGFVGDFAPDALLWEGPGERVCAARAPLSDRAEHVLKIVSPIGVCDGVRSARLLDAAETQRRCAESGAGWIRVVDAGELGPGSAYAVTEAAPRSAEELIRLRIRLRPSELARIIGGVIDGLRVMRDRCDGRVHGALRPSNVFVIGDRPRAWRGVLTDPAPADLLGPNPEANALAEQRALGSLIAQLVTFRTPRDGKLAGDHDRWDALGRTGGAWRSLCESLLTAPDPLDLDDLASRVEKLRRRAERPRAQRRYAGVAALVGLVAVGAFLVFGTGGDASKGGSTRAPFEEAPFRAWCADAELWALYLQRDAQTRRAELELDPHLRDALLPVIDEAAAREIELDPRTLVRASPRSRLRLTEMVEPDERNRKLGGRTTEALDIIGRWRGAIASWPALTGARERASSYPGRGWRPQGAFYAHLADRVLPPEWLDPETGAANVPESIDESFGPEFVENLIQLSEADRLGAEIDAAWTRLTERIDAIRNAAQGDGAERPADPLLARFAELPERHATFRGLGGDLESVRDLHRRVTELDALSGRIEAFLADGWERVDHEYFASVSEALAGHDAAQAIRLEDFELWLAEASDPGVTRLEPESDPRLAYGGAEAFEPLPDRVGALKDRYGEDLFTELLGQSDLVDRVEAERAAARSLDQIPWKRLTQEEVNTGAASIAQALTRTRTEIDTLAGELDRVATAYLDQLRAGSGISPAGTPSIDAAWRAMRNQLLARYDEDGRFADLRRDEAPAREVLLEVERAVTLEAPLDRTPRGFERAMLDPVLAERTDRAAGEILGHLAWNGTAYEIGSDFEDVRAGVIEREVAWRARLADLVSDHATIETLLDEGWLLDEASPEGAVRELALRWRESEELGDPRVREGLAGVIDRVGRLEAIEAETETGRLMEAISAGDEEPVGVLAAYLGLDRADPMWPGSTGQLDAERRALAGAIEAAERLASEDRVELVLGRVRAAARERWARFANAAQTLADVDAAAQSREAFGAGLEGLRPRPAYNVALREFMLGVNLDMDEEALRQRVAELRDRLAPLRPGVGDSRAERLIDEIAQIAMPPDDSRPVLEASMFGPGRHGWSASDIDGGERLVYTTNHRGQPLTLEFVRIEPDSVNGLSRAAYVSRREVSLGVALAMCDAVGDWETLGDAWLALADARQTASEPGGQRWDGARVWRWDPGLDRGRGALTVNDAWLMRHPQITPEQPAYPPGIGDPQDPLRIDASQGRPGMSMPMNHVSPRAAEALAGALSARLPTEQEWRAALARGGATPNANRRDATFARQRDWVRRVERELTATGAVSQFSYPDRGAYQPRSVSTPTDGAATTLPTDDGVLWLAPVDAPGAMFSHLVGNVAEIVRQGERFAVIGASALSAPEVDPETAYTARNAYARRGFNDDVGFRLALDVPDGVFRQTVNRRLEKLLARAECVFEP